MTKRTKTLKIICLVSIIILILTSIFLIYTIYLYNGIENFLRLMLSLGILLFINIIIGTIYLSMKYYKFKCFIVSNIVSLLFSVLFTILSLFLYTAYSKLDNLHENVLMNKTILISKNISCDIDKIIDKKIGIVEDKTNIEGNILPLEVIKKYKLKDKNEIIEFSGLLELMNALYKEKVDFIFVPNNYIDLFKTTDAYKDIKKETDIVYKYKKKVKKNKEDFIVNKDKTDKLKPVTILLLGIDSADDGIETSSSFNSDTIMLITFNPITLNATMFSIPRDTYVTMACGNKKAKINHAAWGGTNCVVKTVELLTGLKIDYYAKINFKGVVDLVDILGGITVDVPVPDFEEGYCLEDSHRVYKNVCLTPGIQRLDGEHALALSRVRKAFKLGDFKRGQNQQLVVEGLINELKNVKSAKKVYKILDTISRNIDTNMTTDEILSYYNVGKRLLFSNGNNIFNIQKTWLRGYDLNIYDTNTGNYFYTFQYYQSSLDDIIDAMKINLGQKEKEIVKEISFSLNDLYEKKVIGNDFYAETKLELVPNFLEGYTLNDILLWGQLHNININKEYISSGEQYNSMYPDGKILSQSVHEGVLVSDIKEITIYIIKKEELELPILED